MATGNPFSTLAASRNYAHGVSRTGTTRNIGAALGSGAGQVQPFRPGETSPGSFAIKLASTLMGSGQRLAEQKRLKDQDEQNNYARQLQIARMEQGLDPNYMSRYQRGEEYDREHPTARPASPRATVHLTAAQATRYGVGKTEGEYDPDLITAERGQRNFEARKIAAAHAAKLSQLGKGLDDAEKSTRDRMKSESDAAVLRERKQADKYLTDARGGDEKAMRGLGLDPDSYTKLTGKAQSDALKGAYDRQIKLVEEHARGGVSDKYQPMLDKISDARYKLIDAAAKASDIPWDDEKDDETAPAPPAASATQPSARPSTSAPPAGLVPKTDPRSVVGLGPGVNPALSGQPRPLAPSAQQFINGLNQFGGAPATQPQHVDADEGAGAGYSQ